MVGGWRLWSAAVPCVGADVYIGPPTGLAIGWRLRVSARLRPQCRAGDFARRFEVCAAAGFQGRCKHRPLRNTGQGSAGFCRISPPQAGNAPLRLRLAAHPPSGLRCPHRTARAEARLCSATVKPAPSRFLRRRRHSTPQPLAGEAFWGNRHPKGSPIRGAVGVSRLRGAAPCLANTLSGRREPSPAGVNARPTMQGIRAAGPGGRHGRRMAVVERRCPLRRGRCLHRPTDGPGDRLAFAGQCPFTAAM